MRVRTLQAIAAACTLLLAAPAVSAQTVVLDFEEVVCPPPGTGFGGINFLSDYTFGGYTISTTSVGNNFRPAQAVWCDGYSFAGSQAWFVNFILSSTSRLSRQDGGRFDIASISLGPIVPRSGAEGPITFIGTRAQGGVVTQTFDVPFFPTPTLSPFIFDPGFTNLTALEWTSGSTGAGPNPDLANVQIDNLVLTRTVPEPGTVALLAVGFACLVGGRRLRATAAEL